MVLWSFLSCGFSIKYPAVRIRASVSLIILYWNKLLKLIREYFLQLDVCMVCRRFTPAGKQLSRLYGTHSPAQ